MLAGSCGVGVAPIPLLNRNEQALGSEFVGAAAEYLLGRFDAGMSFSVTRCNGGVRVGLKVTMKLDNAGFLQLLQAVFGGSLHL